MKKRSLRRSLIGQTLLLALLPVIGAALIAAFVLYDAFSAEIRERNDTIAKVAAQSVDFYLKETRDLLYLLRDEANTRHPLEEGEAYFSDERLMSIIWNIEQIESIRILDQSGEVRQVYPPALQPYENTGRWEYPFLDKNTHREEVWWGNELISIYPGVTVFPAALSFEGGWIVLAFNPAQLTDLIHRSRGEEFFTAIINRHGTFIAHPNSTLVNRGKQEPHYEEYKADGRYREGSGFTEYRGTEYLLNLTPVLLNDWAVVSYQDVSQVVEGVRQSMVLFGLLLTITVAAAVIFSFRKIGKVVNPLEEIRRRLAWVEQHDFRGDISYSGYSELEALSQQFNEMRKELAATYSELNRELEEKSALLREVHHRVKNNLQMIISLLNLQSNQVQQPEAEQVLQESSGRLLSVALVYEQFYASGSFSTVDFREYLLRSTELILGSYGEQTTIRNDLAIEELSFDITEAVPLGLIAHELLTNAAKHAFRGRDEGMVRVELKKSAAGKVQLAVEDDGLGLPGEIDFSSGETMGGLLVQTLVRQIHGTLSVSSGPDGSTFIVEFTPRKAV